MSRRIGVVVNPERTDVADAFVAAIRSRGCSVTTATPDGADGIIAAIDELVADGVDVIAAVGGDGTQRIAAARLAGGDVPLAVVPGGTVNLLAQVLGVDDLDRAAAAAAGGRRRRIDLGRADGEPFVLNAGTGWDGEMIQQVGDAAKRFGRLGYFATGVTTWVRTRAVEVEIELDGAAWFHGRALTVMVMNVGQRGSASIHVAPEAEIDDGRLDVVVLRRHSLAGFFRFAVAILRGDPPPSSEAAIGQAERVTVRWARPVGVQCDGDERDTAARFRYDVAPDPVDVMVPAE